MPAEHRGERRIPRTVARTALIVTATEKGREVFKALLADTGFRAAAFAENGGEARRMLVSQVFDAVIVNAPLPDEFGAELARFAAGQGLGVLLAVKGEHLDEVSARVAGDGVLTVGKPLSATLFRQALGLLDAAGSRVEQAAAENQRLRQKLEEAKAVGRAKCLLVQYRGLTEAEAHRFIEKEAMDRRIGRKAVAAEIIQTYGEDDYG